MDLSISLSPEVLFYIGNFPITNSFFWSLILSAFLVGFLIFVSSKLKMVPGRVQGIVELILEEGYSFILSITNDDKKARKIFPLVITMFIFIVSANLATYIPGQSAVTLFREGGEIPLFRAVISDYGLVFMMTLITIIIIQIVTIAAMGPLGYIGKFINLKSPIGFFLGLMDIVGEIAKVVSLSFRLFGNIFAGEVLGSVMLFLLPFVLPLPFMFLGLLTAFVQAFVFSVLTLVFITMASETSPEEEKA